MAADLSIGIMGAGAVGCYVGGRLAAAGADVVFVGRERLKRELEASGLILAELGGEKGRVVPRERVVFATEASTLGGCDVVLCCVKSAQTEEAGQALARVLRPGTIVVSLQNGVGNAAVLREQLSEQLVLNGIVSFNVVSRGGGAFRRATSGPLVIEKHSDPRLRALSDALVRAGQDVELAGDIRPMQWAKLVMNLNNAVGALSDRPTPELLSVKGYRRILRALVREALDVLRAAGVRPGRVGPLRITLFPFILGLPSPLLRVMASTQVKIDPEARSSMWEDLTRGRPTEVDYLNGEIVRLAKASGAAAPLNARMVTLVHDAEKRAAGSPKLSPEALWAALTTPTTT